MSDTADLLMGSAHGGGINVCGIAPRQPLVTWSQHPCWNCEGNRVVRRFSGSGWYEDHLLCMDCGENVATGYRPFERAWRKKNIATAEEWLGFLIPQGEFKAVTGDLIREEMGLEKQASRDSAP